ncbi:hypothetical protein CDAR_443641 [Caerostris darwini]|uniref:Uncharacterized protein n=1 Tax=Caerostris darwini TaxID=1538125 RepID=A0AAV4TND0_9ARAC|nr:hypothetical protein CDAR_443641 [Caerostris darwini]
MHCQGWFDFIFLPPSEVRTLPVAVNTVGEIYSHVGGLVVSSVKRSRNKARCIRHLKWKGKKTRKTYQAGDGRFELHSTHKSRLFLLVLPLETELR